jgi:predicted metal-dependent phosphoesterase TrpH
MMTEHDTGFDPARFGEYREACARASTSRCRLIPGIEYSSPENDVHILTWGLSHFLAEHRPVMETLRGVRAGGGVAVFAHPARRKAWQQFRSEWAPLLAAIEVWNRKSDGLRWSHEALNLAREYCLPPTVGMDFHRVRHLYPLTNRFDVPPASNLEAALVDALARGSQVASALGRVLFGEGGRPKTFPHVPMERLRQGILAIIGNS